MKMRLEQLSNEEQEIQPRKIEDRRRAPSRSKPNSPSCQDELDRIDKALEQLSRTPPSTSQQEACKLLAS